MSVSMYLLAPLNLAEVITLVDKVVSHAMAVNTHLSSLHSTQVRLSTMCPTYGELVSFFGVQTRQSMRIVPSTHCFATHNLVVQ